MAGYTNGSGKKPDEPERRTNITSLEEVRKRAEAEAKAKMRAARGPSAWKERVIGAVIIAMALGMVWHWVSPLFQATGGTR
jgi:hypothetical protein